MGQKTHPVGFRIPYVKTWSSRWYADKNYRSWLHEDLKIRERVILRMGQAGISSVQIERTANKVKVFIHTARPGIAIGRKGENIEELKREKVTGFFATVLISPLQHGFETASMMYKWIAQGVEPPMDTRTAGVLATRENYKKVLIELGLEETQK